MTTSTGKKPKQVRRQKHKRPAQVQESVQSSWLTRRLEEGITNSRTVESNQGAPEAPVGSAPQKSDILKELQKVLNTPELLKKTKEQYDKDQQTFLYQQPGQVSKLEKKKFLKFEDIKVFSSLKYFYDGNQKIKTTPFKIGEKYNKFFQNIYTHKSGEASSNGSKELYFIGILYNFNTKTNESTIFFSEKAVEAIKSTAPDSYFIRITNSGN